MADMLSLGDMPPVLSGLEDGTPIDSKTAGAHFPPKLFPATFRRDDRYWPTKHHWTCKH